MVDLVISRIAHLVFAALWAGSVWYVAFVVIPLAGDGAFRTTEPLVAFTDRLRTISRVSALVLLLTGGHLAASGYTADSLVETTNGQLVLVMTGLWLALTAVVEVATARLDDGLSSKKLREPARTTRPLFLLAAALALGLLVVAGAITADAARLL